MKRSEVVLALADLASKGKYEVSPAGAKLMNSVFVAVAEVINELEAEEAAEDANTPAPVPFEVPAEIAAALKESK